MFPVKIWTKQPGQSACPLIHKLFAIKLTNYPYARQRSTIHNIHRSFGSLLVIDGLALFVEGLEMGLFPIGEAMAHSLARKGSLFWLLCFAFGGFSCREL